MVRRPCPEQAHNDKTSGACRWQRTGRGPERCQRHPPPPFSVCACYILRAPYYPCICPPRITTKAPGELPGGRRAGRGRRPLSDEEETPVRRPVLKLPGAFYGYTEGGDNPSLRAGRSSPFLTGALASLLSTDVVRPWKGIAAAFQKKQKAPGEFRRALYRPGSQAVVGRKRIPQMSKKRRYGARY